MNQPAQPKKSGFRIVNLIIVLLIVLTTTLVLNSYLVKHFFIYWFEGKGATITIDDLRLNLLDGQFAIDNLKAVDGDGQQIAIEHLNVHWLWRPLTDKHIDIQAVSIDGLRLDIEGQQLKPERIGPLDLALLIGDGQPRSADDAAGDEKAWGFELGKVELANIKLCYRDTVFRYKDVQQTLFEPTSAIDNCVQWQNLTIDSHLSVLAAGVEFRGSIDWRGLTITDSKDRQWFAMEEIKIANLNLSDQRLVGRGLRGGQGKLFADVGATISAGFGRVAVDNMTFDLNQNEATVARLELQKTWLKRELKKGKDTGSQQVAWDKLRLASGSYKAPQLTLSKINLTTLSASQQQLESHLKVDFSQFSVRDLGVDLNRLTAQLSEFSLEDISVDQQDKQQQATIKLPKFTIAKLSGSGQQLALEKLQIRDSMIEYVQPKTLAATLEMVVVDLSHLKLDYASELSVNEQEFSVSGLQLLYQDSHSGQNNKVSLRKINLAQLSAQLSSAPQAVNTTPQLSLSAATVALDRLAVRQQEDAQSIYHSLIDFKRLKLRDLAVTKAAQIAVGFKDLQMDDSRFWQQASDDNFYPLLNIAKLVLDNGAISESQQKIDGLGLTSVALLPEFASKGKPRPIVQVAELNLDHALLTQDIPQTITLDQLSIAGLDTLLRHSKKQGLNAQQWFKETEQSEANPDEATVEPPARIVRINQLRLDQDSKVTFVDDSSSKAIEHHLSDIILTLSNLEIGPAAPAAKLELSGKIEQEGLLTVKGTVNPNDLMLNLTGKLKRLSLPLYTDLAANAIGYRIDRGQLDVDFKVKVKDNQLDSDLDILLRKFELAKLQAHEQTPNNAELGIPLPLALNLLRDRDNNIQLDLPIEGDLNSPQLAVSSIISVVMFKALKTAVVYHYSPLGMLSFASDIVDLATALRFEPIVFAPMTDQLDEPAKVQLDKLGKLLKNKPKVDLVLCGNANLVDFNHQAMVDFQQNTNQNEQQGDQQKDQRNSNRKNGRKSGQKDKQTDPADPLSQPPTPIKDVAGLTVEQQRQLLALAEHRQTQAKQYLVEQHQVNPERLLLCQVKFSSRAEAKPKVEISI